ncbi:MAG: Holliday junction branch migration protein RuvA [Parcubacteria group bacterium]|nr:Holliday junction branch migration protein RuvA [Parcubacteria group bacterium]
MVSSLRGKIIHKFNDSGVIVIEVGGVGYGVAVRSSSFFELKKSGDIFLFIHEHIREDARDLYGFETADELKFFKKLVGVSGVGPKMALNILSLRTTKDLCKAIEKGDIGFLTELKGVGKKIAQKIILELKGKLVDGETSPEDDEIIDALKNLGYSFGEAREAIKKIPKDMKSTEDRLRESLKHLAR